MSAQFVPGLELARRFYVDVVRGLLGEAFPLLPHSAALLGPGSEVLGFDTERSTDHNWGPRLQIFLHPRDVVSHAEQITGLLAERLPATFGGYPTRFALTTEPDGAARHRVQVIGLGSWLTTLLGFDPRRAISEVDWLATPAQRLAEITGGGVLHDGLHELNRVRSRLAWYPHDIWLYVLACQWQRIAQEEAFVGRCGEVGDEVGSAVVSARVVRDLMRLCLLLQRRYPPYSKWLGVAFSRLLAAAPLTPVLTAVLSASDWVTRERHLSEAYETVAGLHNALGITDPVDVRTRRYHTRPYRVLRAERFTAALLDRITDPRIRPLPLIGAIDQFVDSTDAIGSVELLRATIAAELQLAQPRTAS